MESPFKWNLRYIWKLLIISLQMKGWAKLFVLFKKGLFKKMMSISCYLLIKVIFIFFFEKKKLVMPAKQDFFLMLIRE